MVWPGIDPQMFTNNGNGPARWANHFLRCFGHGKVGLVRYIFRTWVDY